MRPNIYLFQVFLSGSMVYKVNGRSNLITLLFDFDSELRSLSCGICLPPICNMFLLTFISRILDTVDSTLNIHILYHYMVTNYLNPLALQDPVWYVFNDIQGRHQASHPRYIVLKEYQGKSVYKCSCCSHL
jgi:hypothetical protein